MGSYLPRPGAIFVINPYFSPFQARCTMELGTRNRPNQKHDLDQPPNKRDKNLPPRRHKIVQPDRMQIKLPRRILRQLGLRLLLDFIQRSQKTNDPWNPDHHRPFRCEHNCFEDHRNGSGNNLPDLRVLEKHVDVCLVH